jgi:hypothetical protein
METRRRNLLMGRRGDNWRGSDGPCACLGPPRAEGHQQILIGHMLAQHHQPAAPHSGHFAESPRPVRS